VESETEVIMADSSTKRPKKTTFPLELWVPTHEDEWSGFPDHFLKLWKIYLILISLWWLQKSVFCSIFSFEIRQPL
jgi:hypothetical protein